MIVAAALCPAPPLLVRELTGAEPVAAELRGACLDVVAELMAAAPDVVAVVGAADRTSTWNGGAALDLARLRARAGPAERAAGRPRRRGGSGRGPAAGLPPRSALAPGCSARPALRRGAGASCSRSALTSRPSRCAGIGARLAGARERVALLVMADGSARRGLQGTRVPR